MGRIIKNSAQLLRFAMQTPGVRRWFVSRIFEGPQSVRAKRSPAPKACVDLYYAPATETLLRRLARFSPKRAERFLLQQPSDRLEWWGEEDFDFVVHMPLDEFREVLNRHSSYPAGQPIEEGMVFVEISKKKEVWFVQFSLQARKESEEVFHRLMDEETEEGGGHAAG
jgi:hypothetical protein